MESSTEAAARLGLLDLPMKVSALSARRVPQSLIPRTTRTPRSWAWIIDLAVLATGVRTLLAEPAQAWALEPVRSASLCVWGTILCCSCSCCSTAVLDPGAISDGCPRAGSCAGFQDGRLSACIRQCCRGAACPWCVGDIDGYEQHVRRSLVAANCFATSMLPYGFLFYRVDNAYHYFQT